MNLTTYNPNNYPGKFMRTNRDGGEVPVAVSVYSNNEVYMRHAEQTLHDIGVTEVVFFDSASLGCWNNPAPETFQTN